MKGVVDFYTTNSNEDHKHTITLVDYEDDDSPNHRHHRFYREFVFESSKVHLYFDTKPCLEKDRERDTRTTMLRSIKLNGI